MVLKVKNFENMLVELFVTGSTEVCGPLVKLIEVDLLVFERTQSINVLVN